MIVFGRSREARMRVRRTEDTYWLIWRQGGALECSLQHDGPLPGKRGSVGKSELITLCLSGEGNSWVDQCTFEDSIPCDISLFDLHTTQKLLNESLRGPKHEEQMDRR